MIVIAHNRDVDGLGCHALVKRYCMKRECKLIHIFADYDDIEKILKRLDVKNERIIVADLAYKRIFGKEIKRIALKNDIVWIDHHNAEFPVPVKSIIKKTDSAAVLLKEYLKLSDWVSMRIAEVASNHDQRRDDPLAFKLYDVISSGFSKRRYVELLSNGFLWQNEFEKAYRDYLKIKEKAFNELEKNIKEYAVRSYRIAIALSPKTLSSTIACDFLKNKGYDVIIAVWNDGKMSFRKNNKRINLIDIAKSFGGGGREDASGAYLGKKVDKSNFDKIADEIFEKIKSGSFLP